MLHYTVFHRNNTFHPTHTEQKTEKKAEIAADTCDDAIFLYRFLPADLERGVQNLSETQVSHSSWLWKIRKGKFLIAEPHLTGIRFMW